MGISLLAPFSSDVAKWLVEFFALATCHKIDAVQEFPGKRARLTFAAVGEAHVNHFVSEGEVTIWGVKCTVVRPAPTSLSYTNVVVFQYPYECDNKWLVKELSTFGTVKDVRFQKRTNIPDCHMLITFKTEEIKNKFVRPGLNVAFYMHRIKY